MAKKCESNDIFSGMLDLLINRGVVEDKRILNPQVRLDKQKRNQMAYHNTELLLKHYRDIVWLLECFPDTIADELEEPMKDVDELIDRLDLEMAKGNRRVENRLRSLEATRLMLDRIFLLPVIAMLVVMTIALIRPAAIFGGIHYGGILGIFIPVIVILSRSS